MADDEKPALKSYRVQYLTTASCVVDVEAADEDEARELADQKFEEESPSLCAHCSGWGQTIGIELSEWEQDETPEGSWIA